MKDAFGNSRTVVVLAVALSLLFSVLSISTNQLLNDDAFSYLKAAEKFGTSGIHAVLEEYGWYGYSILIGLADRMLPGDLLASAHFLNTLAYMLLVAVFILLCMELHPGRNIPCLAALTILCYPMINEMRFMLIRDFAFWAFALLSLQQLVRFCRTGSTLTAAGWCASLFAAIFFRLEGLLMLLSPIFLLWPSSPHHAGFRPMTRLLALLGAGLLLVLLATQLIGIDLPALMRFAYRYYLMAYAELGARLGNSGLDLSGVLSMLAADAWTLAVNPVTALGIPLTVFIAWGLSRYGLQCADHARRPYHLYLLFTTTTLVLFVVIMHFLTQRYTALLCLLLLTQVPASLARLSRLAVEYGRSRALHLAIALYAAYFLIDGFVSFGYSTAYITEAADWARGNIPATATLHTNSPAVAWTSGLVENYDRIDRDPALALQAAASGDYLVLDLHHDDEWKNRAGTFGNLELIREFSNSRDDVVRVYHMR